MRYFTLAANFGRYGKIIFVALLACLVGGSSLYLVKDYRAALREAESRLMAMTNTALEHIKQVFTVVDLALRSIDDDPTTDDIVVTRSPEQLHQILNRAQRMSPALQALGLVGVDGKVYATAASARPLPTVLSDRDFFIQHRDHPPAGLVVSKPVLARPQNMIAIPVSRRIVTADGAFRGIVAARLDPAYFMNFFSALGSDSVILFGPDGRIIARYPQIDLVAAAPIPPTNVLLVRSREAPQGVFEMDSPIDGVRRMVAFIRMQQPDLIVSVSFDKSTVVRGWLMRIYPFLALLGGGVFFLCFIAALLRRHAQDVEAVVAATTAAQHSAERAAAIATDARNLAEEAQHRKSEFLAHMSHEIRTPMNAIIGFAQMIEAQTWGAIGNARYTEYSKDILFSARHLLAVIENVLDLSKLEAGKWKLNEAELSLADLIDSTVRLAKGRAHDDGIEIAIGQGIPDLIVKGDERSLRQVLLNLIVNSIKHAGKDRRVEIDAGVTPQGDLDIAVRDRGMGMTAGEIQQVIKPFESLPSKESRKREGTGLGLPISIAFVELHGGTLSIESKPGEGTVVHVRLPAWRVSAIAAGNTV